jgi:hypothetical protein
MFKPNTLPQKTKFPAFSPSPIWGRKGSSKARFRGWGHKLLKKTLVLTGTRVARTSRYHPGSRLWRAPRYSGRQRCKSTNRQPWRTAGFSVSLTGRYPSGFHVQIEAPEGFSACCVALACTGSRFAVRRTQAYSFPSSPLGCSVGQNYATEYGCGQHVRFFTVAI